MAFGFSNANGEYTPRIKWNAKSGRAFRLDREVDASGNWATNEVDITDAFAFVPDFENLQRGYWNRVTFAEKLGRMAEPMPAKPTELDAQGKSVWAPQVKIHLVLGAKAGGGLRAWSISATCVMSSLERAYTEWAKAPERKQGLYPVLGKTATLSEKSKQGTNYVPQFAFAKWIPKPPDLVAPAAHDEEDEAEPAFGVPASAPAEEEWDATAHAQAPGNGAPVAVGAGSEDANDLIPF